jgi:AcrR family transcriptional regulator
MERLYFFHVTVVSWAHPHFPGAFSHGIGYVPVMARQRICACHYAEGYVGKVIISNEINEISSRDRLIEAVLSLWESHGTAEISVRSIAQVTALPVSSIYHHFGSMEHLFLTAQDSARAATEQWCAAHLDAIPDASDLSPDAFPALMAALIDDWSHAHRRLAFAWRECQLMASRDPRYFPALKPWQRLWSSFWQEVCTRCGLSVFGGLTCHMFDGESLLHLSLWRRAVDRACLEETCQGWSAWLAGRLAPETPWRRFARTEARRSMPIVSISGGVAERIAAAAADTVAEQGVAGLTHRAVAARTDLSLGVVSYNFRTSADLLRAAFEMIYLRVLPFPQGERPLSPIEDRGPRLIDRLVHQPVPVANLLALDELLIAVARNPDLKQFSAQLRYLRGRTSEGLLRAMVGDARSISPLDAALFSGFVTGQRRANVGLSPQDALGATRRDLLQLLTMLGGEEG